MDMNLFLGNIAADICTKRGECQESSANHSIQPIGASVW